MNIFVKTRKAQRCQKTSKNVKKRSICWHKVYSKNIQFFDTKFIQKIDQKLIKKLTPFWTPKTFKFGPPKSPKSSKNRPPDPFLQKKGFSSHNQKPLDLALNTFPKKFYPRFKPIRGKVFVFCNRAPDPLPRGTDPFLDFFRPDSHISTFKNAKKSPDFQKSNANPLDLALNVFLDQKTTKKRKKYIRQNIVNHRRTSLLFFQFLKPQNNAKIGPFLTPNFECFLTPNFDRNLRSKNIQILIKKSIYFMNSIF